jgi:hypothetical protein
MLVDGRVSFRPMVNMRVRTKGYGVWRVYSINFEHIACHELDFRRY